MDRVGRTPDGWNLYVTDCGMDDEHPTPEYELWAGHDSGSWHTIRYFDDDMTAREYGHALAKHAKSWTALGQGW